MIEKLLPDAVAVVEEFGAPEDAPLLPGEEAAVARAVDKRRREYASVRACARQAMAGIGLPPAALPPGERGAPTWPADVVGSMTHCDGYRAAAVAHAAAVAAVGIDAEPHAPLPDGVFEAIALPSEASRHAALSRTSPGVYWDRLLFSAKEAVYKAWFPKTRLWLDFEGADITLVPDGTFAVRIVRPAGPGEGPLPVGYSGRWLVADGLVATAIAELA
ncbi:4'-phosphopantetheinyl transferase family protein [Actinomadura rupiterrae]|uniref:4'-phosphopantetheinyl transferase family protein n=1 Tax=Actinomadura rupiterrae TaxID=559627 RepID=UPI0020A5EB7C|nr:4'-phosphopantetheinyl transferase superfamily protein [Actinomadura rupiterrae]MCP2342690.1 4'-phosphopantetheinyl transferase EntD [Actinomadura rupiterrae]